MHSYRVRYDRGVAHPLRGQHDTHKGGASFSKNLEVVKCIKQVVAILNRTFTTMHPFEVYYVNQAGGGLTTPGNGPVYSGPLYLQRGQGMGNFFGNLFRWVRPLLWSEAKALGRETLCAAGKILTAIAARKSTDDVSAGDIVSEHVNESAQNLISKSRSRDRKRLR